MEKIKTYIFENFEQVFVFVILVTVALLNYYIPQKIAFLNFYFLPVIIAGYFLDQYHSVIGAFFCILLVTIYIILSPTAFITPNNWSNLIFHVIVWGSFLILSGAVVGKQNEKLNQKIQQTTKLNCQLQQQQEELKIANKSLTEYSKTLEEKVKERTINLKNSKEAIEILKTKVEETLYTTMDPTVVKLIIEGRLRNEKRRVSVMFSDLVGFSSYSEERSPELVVRDLNRYLSDMEPILLNYHGHIDKYMGDGIMCEFGAPVDYENYRLLAVLAGLKLQEKLASLDYPWKMRIGISSGATIVGLIGYRRQSYTSIGDVVNLSSRLEKECPPGEILIDGFTMEGIHRFIDVRMKRQLPHSQDVNPETEAHLETLHRSLDNATHYEERADLYLKIGQIYISLTEIHDALEYFEKGLQMCPDNKELKVAFADATIKQNEIKKMKIKGRKQRVSAFEVIGIKNILLDRDKIPEPFYKKYYHATNIFTLPEDLVLPVEAVDGSIGHSKAVAVFSYAIASDVGVSDAEKKEILQAAFLADIGKTSIPHHLLNARSSLRPGEIKEIEKHTLESVKIFQQIGYNSEEMLRMVRHSHENFDGSGYPDCLRGEEIPLGSRIIAVADAYNAMTSWRPYREKWDRNAAFDELIKSMNKGIFDPGIVQRFIKLMN
ncbi:MAG: HD domain-containing phosphohydrolase [bacterium]